MTTKRIKSPPSVSHGDSPGHIHPVSLRAPTHGRPRAGIREDNRMGNTRAVRRHLALALVAGVVTAAAGAVLAGPAAAAEGKIREAGTPTVVKDSYVVVLKDSARLRSRGVTASVSDLVSRYGGRTGRTYSHALKGFEVSVGASAA